MSRLGCFHDKAGFDHNILLEYLRFLHVLVLVVNVITYVNVFDLT